MKAVSAIIAVILILMIVVALAALVWLWLSGLFTSLSTTGTSAINQTIVSLSSCMKIDTVSQNKVYLRNCGQGIITNNSLSIYLDDVPFNFNMTPSSINQGELATVALPVYGISIGLHTLKITNPYTQIIKQVESVLPDSAVLALDFEEGEGNYVYDTSLYHNNGVLSNGSTICNGGNCPQWTTGKYGKAIKFDGINDYVNISDSDNLDIINTITIEAWVYPLSWSSSYPRIVSKENTIWAEPYALELVGNSGGIWYNYTTVCINITGEKCTNSTVNSINLNAWYHVLGNWNGTRTKIYLNGELANSATITGTLYATNYNVLLGSNSIFSGSNNRTFNGIIDSVRIYNKALTPDETVILKIK